jgi:hypothetical protein
MVNRDTEHMGVLKKVETVQCPLVCTMLFTSDLGALCSEHNVFWKALYFFFHMFTMCTMMPRNSSSSVHEHRHGSVYYDSHKLATVALTGHNNEDIPDAASKTCVIAEKVFSLHSLACGISITKV